MRDHNRAFTTIGQLAIVGALGLTAASLLVATNTQAKPNFMGTLVGGCVNGSNVTARALSGGWTLDNFKYVFKGPAPHNNWTHVEYTANQMDLDTHTVAHFNVFPGSYTVTAFGGEPAALQGTYRIYAPTCRVPNGARP